MKERFKEIVSKYEEPLLKLNIGREYLQELILFLLYKNGFVNNLIFEGGTALRLIYELRRFSEDLNFSLSKEIDSKNIKKILERELLLMNYDVEIRLKEEKNVVVLNVKFSDLFEILNLSYNKQLSIHIEIDINPPKGGKYQSSLIGKEFYSRVYHYDLPSLFSKKLHAIFFREYEKGRDYYDLLWCLKRNIKPNSELLYNATLQTNPKEVERLRNLEWKGFLKEKINNVNFNKIQKDIKPFIENPDEMEFINKKDILKLLIRIIKI